MALRAFVVMPFGVKDKIDEVSIIFDRYHIVSPADLHDVARRLAGTGAGTAGVSW